MATTKTAEQLFYEGNNQMLAGDSEGAAACFRAALALAPDAAPAWTNLGMVLADTRQAAEAEHCYRTALALNPGSAETYTNLAHLLTEQKRFSEAEQACRQALAIMPGAAAHSNYGVLLACLGREAEAERCYRSALACEPRYGKAYANLSYLLLRQGRWVEGWRCFEFRNPAAGATAVNPPPPFARWQGEPLAGKSLLVMPEQGYGDEIQFCRYLPLLKEHGARRLVVVCKPRLKRLFGTLAGVDAVYAAGEMIPAEPFDYWTHPMSFPLHCGTTTPDLVPARLPYLHATPVGIARWRERLPPAGFRAGLAWKGNDRHENDADRSLPHLRALAPLWQVPGIQFLSLQRGPGEHEPGEMLTQQPLLPLGAELEDFADTAAIVEQLDLVIAVDTAVAHLAGALGKTCWLLLPAYKTDWRWLTECGDSPWYPGVMRLFRQQPGETWGAVIERVRQALTAAVSNPTPTPY